MTSGGPSPRKIRKLANQGFSCEGSLSDDQTEDMILATREALSECQKELDNLNEKATEEILQVERRYNKLRKPVCETRSEVIEKIPNFWLNVFATHPQTAILIDEDMEHIFHFLKTFDVEHSENGEDGFRLKFVFAQNPYFENEELVKEFRFGSNPRSSSTEIKWRENMESIRSKEQSGITHMSRKRGPERRTFFSWFSDNRDPAADDIAEVIKDELWPNPLQYYRLSDIESMDKAEINRGEEDEMQEKSDGEEEEDLANVSVDESGTDESTSEDESEGES